LVLFNILYLYRIIWEASTLGWCYQPECLWHRCWYGSVDPIFVFYDRRKWRCEVWDVYSFTK
jgi:hypothetical protein